MPRIGQRNGWSHGIEHWMHFYNATGANAEALFDTFLKVTKWLGNSHRFIAVPI